MVAIFANNATGKLGGDVTTSSTTLILQTGNGALFPSPTAGDYFPITVVKADGTLEIMKCTARSVDTLTVTRSQEGTTAKAFTIGDRVSLRMTAGSLVDFVSNKQPLDATLTALAGVATAADKLIYATGADTFDTTTLTAFIRTVLDDATASDVLTTLGMSTFIKSLIDDLDAATARATLGAQAADPTLTALAGVTTAADKLIYATAADTFSTTTLSAFARTLLDDADAATMRSTIGAISSTDMTNTLSSYATTSAMNSALSNNINTALSSYSTTSNMNTEISNAINNAFNGATIQYHLELGRHIDFHTSSVLQDFDARIICGAGNNTNNGASLSYQANGHYFDSNINVGSAFIQTDGNIYMPWAGKYLNSLLGEKIAATDVPTATANNIAAGGVGSYALAINTNQGLVTFGATYAGSNLKPTSLSAYQGTNLSGTWRCMGDNSGTKSGTLYLRIS